MIYDINRITWDDEADVLVIGGGTATFAAIEAADNGAQVILIDKQPNLGGDTAISGGVIYASETSVQKSAGVVDERTGKPDSIDNTFNDWMRSNEHKANATLVRKILKMGPELIHWFIERGAVFDLYVSGIDPVKRGHTIGGKAFSGSGANYLDILIREMTGKSIKVFTETKAVDILRDINGNIIGVLAQNKNSGMKYYKTKAVIIGTGTNTHNFEFIMRYNPETIKRETIHGPWGTGDGIIMAEKLNAKFEGFGETIFGKTAGDGVALFEGTREVEQLVAYHDWVKKDKRAFIYVNENGNRYADETLGYQGATGLEIRNQPSGVGICILDQTLYADPGYFAFSVAGTKEKLDDAVKTGLIKKAHSLEKLASLLEINDIDVFINTVAIYNRYAERGEDLEFGRAVETLRPITQPPFYGYRVRSSGRDAKIFISVNENCQVLDRDGWVIPGLYATGDTISYATRGHGYPGSGVSLASGFAAGRIAGQHATLSLTKNLRS